MRIIKGCKKVNREFYQLFRISLSAVQQSKVVKLLCAVKLIRKLLQTTLVPPEQCKLLPSRWDSRTSTDPGKLLPQVFGCVVVPPWKMLFPDYFLMRKLKCHFQSSGKPRMFFGWEREKRKRKARTARRRRKFSEWKIRHLLISITFITFSSSFASVIVVCWLERSSRWLLWLFLNKPPVRILVHIYFRQRVEPRSICLSELIFQLNIFHSLNAPGSWHFSADSSPCSWVEIETWTSPNGI